MYLTGFTEQKKLNTKKLTTKTVSIRENLSVIKEQIGSNKVKIIAVTKYANWDQIAEAYKSGISDFAESYVQDALQKFSQLNEDKLNWQIKWHFIGRLQKNKAKFSVGNFSLIQSVDSVELAKQINKVAMQKGVNQEVLLQINTSKEEQKGGFKQEAIKNYMSELLGLKNIDIKGYMTIAPNTNDQSLIRECFLQLLNLKDKINKEFKTNLKELSMGMSNDYKLALECGSTMVRLGRAIFRTDT